MKDVGALCKRKCSKKRRASALMTELLIFSSYKILYTYLLYIHIHIHTFYEIERIWKVKRNLDVTRVCNGAFWTGEDRTRPHCTWRWFRNSLNWVFSGWSVMFPKWLPMPTRGRSCTSKALPEPFPMPHSKWFLLQKQLLRNINYSSLAHWKVPKRTGQNPL